MSTRTTFRLAVMMVAVLALAVPQLAQAVGTDFGTTITNNVTIQYGSGPSTITTSTSVNFLVDRVLDWTIAPSTAVTVGVFPGSTGNAIAYSVQNATNGTVDILFTLTTLAAAPSTVTLYADDGGTPGVFDSTDTALPPGASGFYIDEVGEDTAPTIFIVVDAMAAATTTDVYSFEIASVTREGNGAGLGAALADDSGNVESSILVQNVYNDGAGYNDAAGDLNYTAYAAFQVVVPSLTATKTAVVTADGLGNVAPNAKAIPGATVHYTISITNSGTATATAVNITDDIPTNTTFLGGLVLGNPGVGGTETYVAGPPAQVTVTGETIAVGQTMTLDFDVTID